MTCGKYVLLTKNLKAMKTSSATPVGARLPAMNDDAVQLMHQAACIADKPRSNRKYLQANMESPTNIGAQL
jgi:hypothetical protein